MATTITYIRSASWEAVYVDSQLYMQTEQVTALDAFSLMLQHDHPDVTILTVNEQWINRAQQYPDNLSDVVTDD